MPNDIQDKLPAARAKAWANFILNEPLDFFYDMAEGFTSDRELEDLADALAQRDAAAVGRLIIHSLDQCGTTDMIEEEAYDIAHAWQTYGEDA